MKAINNTTETFTKITHDEAMDIIASMTDRSLFSVDCLEIHTGDFTDDNRYTQVMVTVSGECVLSKPFVPRF